MKSSLTVLLVFFWCCSQSQNLVPNGGFESVAVCPGGPGQLYLASPWDTLNVSSDLFHGCSMATGNCMSVNVPENFAGSVSAYSGVGYAGMLVYSPAGTYREYIQAPLIQPLQAGEIYRVSARLRRSANSSHAVASLGMTLTSGPLVQSGTSSLGFTPQVETQGLMNVSNQWIMLEGFIVATGGENNIAIGNFRDDASCGAVAITASGNCTISGAYYLLDDISVIRINETISISGPPVTCPGVPVTLTANTNTTGWWSTATAPQTPISNIPMITVSPLVTTTYYFNGIQNKDSITIEVIDPPQVNLGHNAAICEGTSLTLDATCFNCSYQWSTGATTASISISAQGIYLVSVHNGGCAARDTFFLTVNPAPEVIFEEDMKLCPLMFEQIVLNAGNDGVNYQWMPGNFTGSSITVTSAGTYSVIKEYANGCTRTAEVEIKESCIPLVFVPKGFTPNGDGINDKLGVEMSGAEKYSIRIYNRWGELIFESSDQSWDGKIKGDDAPEGVYWHHTLIQFIDTDGKIREKFITGSITLIR